MTSNKNQLANIGTILNLQNLLKSFPIDQNKCCMTHLQLFPTFWEDICFLWEDIHQLRRHLNFQPGENGRLGLWGHTWMFVYSRYLTKLLLYKCQMGWWTNDSLGRTHVSFVDFIVHNKIIFYFILFYTIWPIVGTQCATDKHKAWWVVLGIIIIFGIHPYGIRVFKLSWTEHRRQIA
jgi:hypothetical protein